MFVKNQCIKSVMYFIRMTIPEKTSLIQAGKCLKIMEQAEQQAPLFEIPIMMQDRKSVSAATPACGLSL